MQKTELAGWNLLQAFYPILWPELESLRQTYPEIMELDCFMDTLWAIVDSEPALFVEPLSVRPPSDLRRAVMYLRARRDKRRIIGWLSAYQEALLERELRFAAGLHIPAMRQATMDLLLRCAARIADHARAASKRKPCPKLL